jgi:hypothetical protein
MSNLIPLINELPAQQAIFLHHLRENPNNVTQITGSLIDDNSHMCAVGLGVECFGLIRDYRKAQQEEKYNRNVGNWGYTPYDIEKELSERLGINKDDLTSIYQLNDDYELSFAKIADILEIFFKELKRNGNVSYRTPEQIYEEEKAAAEEAVREDFIRIWAEHQAKAQVALNVTISSLNAELAKLPVGVETVYVDEYFVTSDPADAWYDHVDY